mmetsp:Transcript_3040/g.9061  ORF Transcript_3040/g.9061 Transcript_3040/m.9061 type:complete len:175 (-) Transcript_3040:642-1166(-)
METRSSYALHCERIIVLLQTPHAVTGVVVFLLCALESVFFKFAIDSSSRVLTQVVVLVTPYVSLYVLISYTVEFLRILLETCNQSSGLVRVKNYDPCHGRLPRDTLLLLASLDVFYLTLAFATAPHTPRPLTVLLLYVSYLCAPWSRQPLRSPRDQAGCVPTRVLAFSGKWVKL